MRQVKVRMRRRTSKDVQVNRLTNSVHTQTERERERHATFPFLQLHQLHHRSVDRSCWLNDSLNPLFLSLRLSPCSSPLLLLLLLLSLSLPFSFLRLFLSPPLSFSYFLACTHAGIAVASGDCKCIHITNTPMCVFHTMFDPNITSSLPLLVSSRNSQSQRRAFFVAPAFVHWYKCRSTMDQEKWNFG